MSDKDSVVTVDELDESAGWTAEVEEKQTAAVPEKKSDGWASRGDNRGWSGGDRQFGRQGDGMYQQGQAELGSKVLHIQSKKFFVDIKESRRGKFVKLSEVALNGSKNRMTMELKSAVELHEKLTDFISEYSKLGPRSSGDTGRMTKLKSETIFATERRYYLDLKENRAGRFLKIAMTMPPPNFDRCEIVIPAQGMVDLRDAIVDLINEFGGDIPKETSSDKFQTSKEKEVTKDESGASLKAGGKTFYVSVTKNNHGTLLKISEVSTSFKTGVNIPYEYWGRFLELLKKNAAGASESNGNDSGAQATAMDEVE